MSDTLENNRTTLSPSAFMRRLRPEYYSDTVDRTIYQLDAPTLAYHLDTITARNQTHAFEIFCRKLCERTICPNLKPSTGPEGGGDSKADTETIPIANEIAKLTYVGEANGGRERWAFAFSAKKRWTEKARSDIAGIFSTGRGYQKIFFITSRHARARDRARVEDELTNKYGVTVTILDRTWIVEQVIDADRKDLAFNYLDVGQEVADTHRLGPSDYSRAQQLENIEKELVDPQAFAGMELQRATEALVAAKLSRNLERPRVETDGRFTRAIRFADDDGTYRQRLEARYEWIWTGFWWFDDIAQLNSGYDAFATLAFETEHAKDLEFLCNLFQLLINAVVHDHLTADDAKLTERIARLSERLEVMASDDQRPNNALEARTSLLVIRANQALLEDDQATLTALWPQFSDILKRAKGLGEFAAERLTKMIEAFGNVTRRDPGYAHLIDDVATFISERTSEAQGAIVLLRRAEQLDFDDKFEMIRLLGKASYQLAKKEYTGSFIEAMRLLSIAYRSAGLLWAARASCIFVLASIFIEAEEDNFLPAPVVPTLMLLAWIVVELRHIPDAFEAIRLVRGCITSLPLTDESREHAVRRLQEFDGVLSSQILNFSLQELNRVCGLPDVLDRLELFLSRTSLLYALGYEPLLREDGSIPAEETPEQVTEFITMLASQPASDNLRNPVILNEPGEQKFMSTVLGIRIEVHHQGSEAAILAAEAIIGSVEALFATTLDLDAPPHAELFTIGINESEAIVEASFTLDKDRMTAMVDWPDGLLPATFGRQDEVRKMLATLSSSIFVTTCLVQDVKGTLRRLCEDDAVLDRIAMITAVGNSRQRFSKSAVSRLSDWTGLAQTTFPAKPSRPNIVRQEVNSSKDGKEEVPSEDRERGTWGWPKDHRDLRVRSVIDIHLWDRAGWTGTAFADWGPTYVPAMALLFTDADAGRTIFERWRERFGKEDEQEELYVAIIRHIPTEKAAHYRVLITSGFPPTAPSNDAQRFMVAARTCTMHPESDVNLRRFLSRYNELRAYWLVPAIWKGQGEPEFLLDIPILKRELSVKNAADIGIHDIEAMALRPGM